MVFLLGCVPIFIVSFFAWNLFVKKFTNLTNHDMIKFRNRIIIFSLISSIAVLLILNSFYMFLASIMIFGSMTLGIQIRIHSNK